MTELQSKVEAATDTITEVPGASGVDIAALLAHIDRLRPHLALPITQLPPPPAADADATTREAYSLQIDTLAAFFLSVAENREDAVSALAPGIVSPNIPYPGGETPLLTAVLIDSTTMVSRLIGLGAAVDSLSRPLAKSGDKSGADRTPLQLAAALGNLAMVRLLVEEHGADDALVAPDGALAVELATANGHSDVVAYLPARSGGAWLRFKTKARGAATAVVAFVAIFVWIIPRRVLYDGPKAALEGRTRIREHLAKAWGVVAHVFVLTAFAIYQLPKEAMQSRWKKLKSAQQKT